MTDTADLQFWTRRRGASEVKGPYEYAEVFALVESQQLTPQHELAFSETGPWFAPTELESLADAFRDVRAANRTAIAVLPHLIAVSTLVVLGFAAPRLTPNAIDLARLFVVVCAFSIAIGYEESAPLAPKWLFWLIAAVFLIPVRVPLNRGGWLVMDWFAACTTVLHGRAIVRRIARPSFITKITDWVLQAAQLALVLSVFAILQCEGSGNDFE